MKHLAFNFRRGDLRPDGGTGIVRWKPVRVPISTLLRSLASISTASSPTDYLTRNRSTMGAAISMVASSMT